MEDRDRAYHLRNQQLRERAARLRAKGLSYAIIGEQLGISAIRARDIILKYQKELDARRAQQGRPALPKTAVSALHFGRYVHLVSGLIAEGRMRTAVIAAAYTWEELLTETGIGPKSAKLIHGWLQAQGLDLRKPGQPVGAAMQAAQYSVQSRSQLAEINGLSFDQSEDRATARRDRSQPPVTTVSVQAENRHRKKS